MNRNLEAFHNSQINTEDCEGDFFLIFKKHLKDQFKFF